MRCQGSSGHQPAFTAYLRRFFQRGRIGRALCVNAVAAKDEMPRRVQPALLRRVGETHVGNDTVGAEHGGCEGEAS